MGLLDRMKEKIRRNRKPAEQSLDPDIEEQRRLTRGSVYRIPGRTEPEYDLSGEQREKLIAGLEKQYQKSLKILKKYELPFEGHHTEQAPSWEQIRQGLTPVILDKVAKLQEPLLLLIPGTTMGEKIATINYNARPHSFESRIKFPDQAVDVQLWNGGSPYMHTKWRIGIAEGLPEIEADPKISGDNYEMAQSWLQTYQGQGLDVINDLDTFLMMVMYAQAAKKPINKKTLTVLNAKNLKPGERLSFGTYDGDQVYLGTAHSNVFFKNIRLRPIVWVPSPVKA